MGVPDMYSLPIAYAGQPFLLKYALRRGDERPVVNGVAQFLCREFLARDVDRAEPFELLAVGAAAHVDHEFVVEDRILLIALEIVEVATVEGEVPVDVLTERDGALLTVDHLERCRRLERPST